MHRYYILSNVMYIDTSPCIDRRNVIIQRYLYKRIQVQSDATRPQISSKCLDTSAIVTRIQSASSEDLISIF
jgi:hypothetical protein